MWVESLKNSNVRLILCYYFKLGRVGNRSHCRHDGRVCKCSAVGVGGGKRWEDCKINHISPVCFLCSLYSVFLFFAAHFRSLYFSVFPVGTFHFSTLSTATNINITTSISPQIHTAYCCTHQAILHFGPEKWLHSHSCIYRLDLKNSCMAPPGGGGDMYMKVRAPPLSVCLHTVM